MSTYYTVLTDIGQAKQANAISLGESVELTALAVGDGGGTLPTPESDVAALVNQQRSAAINQISVDPENPNYIICEQVIPEDVGGWWIREVGIFDADGDLFAYGNFPETYKPQLEEGSGRTQTIRVVIIVSDTAAITLKIDPAVVLATREYVDDERADHEASRNHPSATTSAKGFVELATQAEVDAGTDTTRPVVPARLAQSPLLRGKENDGDPNGSVAADRLYERCWDTSKTPAVLYFATAAGGTVGSTTWKPAADIVRALRADPPLATDGGSGDYTASVSSVPGTNTAVAIRFGSANDAASPTLALNGGSAQPLVDVRGKSWIGMIEPRPHFVVESGGTYVIIDPGVKISVMEVLDERAAGVQGDTIGNPWTTRTLNTVVRNSIDGASLSGNVLTLPAGTFDIDFWTIVHNYNGGPVNTRLRDVGNGETLTRSPLVAHTGGSMQISGLARAELSAPTTIELQSQNEDNDSRNEVNALGVSGMPERYTNIRIRELL